MFKQTAFFEPVNEEQSWNEVGFDVGVKSDVHDDDDFVVVELVASVVRVEIVV